VDIGFGDVITPEPLWVEYPTILDNDHPRIRAYTLESAIAEKYQAMVDLDMANSRIKDFYDIFFLSEKDSFEGSKLQTAIEQKFNRRETPLPNELPAALSGSFAKDDTKIKQWKAFRDKVSDEEVPDNLYDIIKGVKGFLWPVSYALANNENFHQHWEVGVGWK